MSARRNPNWTLAEIAALREAYPGGGLKGALERLPHRSWHSIHMKAQKLGFRCTVAQSGGRRCKLVGQELKEAIKLRDQGLSFARIGAQFGFAECTVSNAVLMAQCVREGYTPAEREPSGRLTPAGHERLRWMLRKGLKGVEIQLRLAVSASTVAEQRRRYNRELRANGKALLPRPGNGESYSGARIALAKRREAERLFLEGFGTTKVSRQSGVSKTACTRIRNRLIRRLKRKGEYLPGCDQDGKRRKMRGHARHIPNELKVKLRGLILDRVPVRRAAAICGIGACSAYRIRDALKAELGDLPKPRLPGKAGSIAKEMMNRQAIPAGQLWRFRALVKMHGDEQARRVLRAEMAEAKCNRTFEQMVEAVAGGAGIGAAFHPRTAGPGYTLGGVTGEVL